MKKLLGILLVLGGMGSAEYGLFWFIHQKYDILRISAGETVLYAVFMVLGLLCILVGRRFYRANGEGPRLKAAMGHIMRVLGAAMILLGGVYIAALDMMSFKATGLAAVLTGLVFLVTGQQKVKAGRSERADARRKQREEAARREEARKADEERRRAEKEHTRRKQENKEQETAPPPKHTKMVCPTCGKTYSLEHVYCDECGSRLRPGS